MKKLLLFIAFCSANAYSGTCTSISRTNFSPNTTISPSSMNSQLNTVYNQVNSLDGGCITDGTVEAAALNSTEFAPLLKSIRQGCQVTESDNNTLSINKCLLSINNVLVSTSSPTTVAFGCSGCSSDTASTKYYLYALTTSTTSALALRISTTAPNADGFDNSGNRVLAKFYNNSLANIDSLSITHWIESGWEYVVTAPVTYTPTITAVTTNPTKGTVSRDLGQYWRDGDAAWHCYNYVQTAAGSAGSGSYLVSIGGEHDIDSTKAPFSDSYVRATGAVSNNLTFISASGPLFIAPIDTSKVRLYAYDGVSASTVVGSASYSLGSPNLQWGYCVSLPILGWD